MKNCDIVIIGSGFVGSSIAEYLQKFFKVVTISRNAQPDWLRKYNIDHKICDIRDYDKLFTLIESPSIVIHTAVTRIPESNRDKAKAYETNVLGTQNVCKVLAKNPNIIGLILTSSMNVVGEKNLTGKMDEEYGYHPERIGKDPQIYPLSKIMQECIVRYYDELFPKKCFGILRFDSVIGERMHKDFFVNIFIEQGLKGTEITPYKNSIYRQMFFTAIQDICESVKLFIELILNDEKFRKNNKNHIFNLLYPQIFSIQKIANIVRESIITHSNGKISPVVKIVDKGIEETYEKNEEEEIQIDVSKVLKILQIDDVTNPKNEIDDIIKKRLMN